MKPFLIFQGPVTTRSGYGDHARDLLRSIIAMDKYDIKVISMRWGNTPMNALEENNPEHQEIAKRIARQNITKQPDVFIQISVPNEFNPVGKYNIGVTAGIETNAVSADFLQGANKMDLIVTTSEHSKAGFNVIYDKLDEKTNEKFNFNSRGCIAHLFFSYKKVYIIYV